MKKLLIIILLLPSLAFADVPTDGFEGYSGDLDGESGGTGWGANWGTTGGCDTLFDATTGEGGQSPQEGSIYVVAISAGDEQCHRDITTNTTDGKEYSIYMAADQTGDGNCFINWEDGADTFGMRMLFDAAGNIIALNNLTDTDVGDYSVDTWYRFRAKIVAYATEDWAIQIDNGGYSSSLKVYNNTAYTYNSTDRLVLISANDPGSKTCRWDNITDATPAAATDLPKPPDALWISTVKNKVLAYSYSVLQSYVGTTKTIVAAL